MFKIFIVNPFHNILNQKLTPNINFDNSLFFHLINYLLQDINSNFTGKIKITIQVL